MRIKLFLLLFLITSILFSQEKIIEGTIIDDFSNPISDCHIINLNTEQITTSDEKGRFSIKVTLSDRLKISHIEFKTKLIRIKQQKPLEVVLLPNAFELEEVLIQPKMSGILGFDFKKVPQTKEEKVAVLVDKFRSNIGKMAKSKVIKRMRHSDDEVGLVKQKSLSDLQFGVQAFSLGLDSYARSKRELRKKIQHKETFPIKLKQELGEDFFFKQLKIPKEKYYHFLEYCNPLGIEELYKQEKRLQLIKVLTNQAKSYLQIIKR